MGRREDARAAAGALHRHAETISDACYLGQGQIDEIPDNNTMISALQKNKLAYPIDGLSGYQLHGKVRGLFDHVTRRHRYRESHSRLAGLVEDLESQIHSYQRAKTKVHSDADFALSQVKEIVMDIMDALGDTVEMFHSVVNDEFSVVSDIDERIRQTRRCIDDISKINVVFESLGVNYMQDWVGHDLQLENLLMKVLKSHVDRCLMDLVASGRKLHEMLAKLVTDKKLQRVNNLIDAFSGKFKREPGYRPCINAISSPPDCLMQTAEMVPGGYANTDSAIDEQMLSELASTVLSKKEAESRIVPDKPDSTEPVSRQTTETIEEQIDPLIAGVEKLFDALMSPHAPDTISVCHAYRALKITASLEDWMLTVMSYYSAQKRALDPLWRLNMNHHVELPVNGTFYVSDITFEKKIGHNEKITD